MWCVRYKGGTGSFVDLVQLTMVVITQDYTYDRLHRAMQLSLHAYVHTHTTHIHTHTHTHTCMSITGEI